MFKISIIKTFKLWNLEIPKLKFYYLLYSLFFRTCALTNFSDDEWRCRILFHKDSSLYWFFLYFFLFANTSIVPHIHSSITTLARRKLRHLYLAKFSDWLPENWKFRTDRVSDRLSRATQKALPVRHEKVARTRSNVIYIRYNGESILKQL